MYDLVIKGAQVADGLGNPLKTADVGVEGGRIAEVGRIDAAAKQSIDADGLVLAPGIVDVHTHYDAQLTWDSDATPSPALGVTTVVVGNCGFSIAPCPPECRDLIARNLAEVEGMSLTALRSGTNWEFESFDEYLGLLRQKGVTPNVAAFIGHSAVRTMVMGEEASERAANDDEVAAMRDLVVGGMDAGAIGFSTSTSINHHGDGGVPMPSRLAEESELRSLVSVLGEKGRGVFQLTVGPSMTSEVMESIAADNGCPVFQTAALHNAAYPERANKMVSDSAAAQTRGNGLWAQVSCQSLSMDFALTAAFPLQSLDSWRPLIDADNESFERQIRDAEFRKRFRHDLDAPQKGKLFYGDWSKVEVAMTARAENRELEGMSIDKLAERQGKDPIDAFFDLSAEEGLGTVYTAGLMNSDEDEVEKLMRQPGSLISLSDGGAHLRYLCDAGYGLHLLGHWVRERGSFDLPDAIRRLTSLPADLYKIADRGRIAPGAHADLLLFDAATVARGPLRRAFDLPGGESRLMRDPVGVHGVWVNGEHVFDGADYVAVAKPGVVIDRFAP
ncbi:MAG: amidohydrolase family protein [Rhodospirillaceae bacterium]|nr:amidohydrolase family protein [Rhodospirillaceae bacterium]MBT5677478.1 amidohydrolase family protein [Rhodospirillaceae bacterium]MBT7291909.1 amidohydrolase family protein [Rhodospirillaceae bacterium]